MRFYNEYRTIKAYFNTDSHYRTQKGNRRLHYKYSFLYNIRISRLFLKKLTHQNQQNEILWVPFDLIENVFAWNINFPASIFCLSALLKNLRPTYGIVKIWFIVFWLITKFMEVSGVKCLYDQKEIIANKKLIRSYTDYWKYGVQHKPK